MTFPFLMVSIDVNNPLKGDNDRQRVYNEKDISRFVNRARNDLETTPGTDLWILEITNPPKLYRVTS